MIRKRFFILTLALLIGFLSYTGIVKAADEEVTDRDMAIASAMSYVPLQKNKTMAQCFDIADIQVISKIVNFVNSKFNLHDYATVHELDEWIVDDYNGGLKVFTQNGFTAFRLINGNNVMIVIRGSNSPVDAFEDIKYGLNNFTKQEKYVKQYVESTLEKYSKKDGNYNFYVTGHSLGGYLAQIAGATMEDKITSNESYSNLSLKKVVDFNGIGINFFTAFGEKYNYGNHAQAISTLKKLGNEGRLIEYYIYGDLVSALGVHYGEMRMLTPSIDSITYHRSVYAVLGKFGKNIVSLAEKNTFLNAFKTNLTNAQNFYQTQNIAAYLNLTHEADTFVTIDLDTSNQQPSVRIIENKNVLSSHTTTNKNVIQATKNITLKALTSYASAKKYEWYVSTDKTNWTLIKTSDLYNVSNGEIVTNTLDIDINTIPTDSSKYYMVKSYYDDNYLSSKYNYNTTKRQYEYVENGNSKDAEYEPISCVIEVKHKKSAVTTIKTKIQSKLSKLFKK